MLPKSEESSITPAFNDDSWGNIYKPFTKSAAKVMQSIHQFKKIENAVKEFLGAPLQLQRALSSMHPRILWTMIMIMQILLFMTVIKMTWTKSRIGYPSAGRHVFFIITSMQPYIH